MGELARGTINDRPWGQTLGALGTRGLTGEVTVMAEGRDYRIAFAHGAVVGASSPLASDAAVRVALTGGLVSSTQVADITRRIAMAPHRDEVDVLAEAARLAPEHAQRLRRRLVAQRAARTFSLDQGQFVIDDRITVPIVPGSELDVRAVVYLGAKSLLSEERLVNELNRLGAWFQLTQEGIADLVQFGFTELEKPVLQRMLEGINLDELERLSPDVGERGVRAIVYALASVGAALGGPARPRHGRPARESIPPVTRTPSTPPPVRRTGSTAIPTTTIAARGTGSTASPSDTDGPARTPRSTSAPANQPRTTTPGSTPPVSRTTTPATTPPSPRTATPTSAPPPSRTATPTSAPPPSRTPTPTSYPPTGRSSSPTISRTQTPSIPPPSRTMTPVATPRTATDPVISRTISGNRSKVPSAPPGTEDVRMRQGSGQHPVVPPGVPRSQRGSSPPANVRNRRNTAATVETERLIADRVALLDKGADHFTLLGITQDASAEIIRAAYFTLARKLHPDRLASLGIVDAQRDAQRLFAQINTAFAVLNDPVRRTDYIAIVKRGGESVVREEQSQADAIAMKVMHAEEAFKRGEMALRREQLEQAIVEFTTAVELAPNEPDYQALLAWTKFIAASDKQAIAQQTRQALARAADRAEHSPTARFYLGRVERILGREREALAHFNEVLTIKPNHAEASSEIRILEARLKKR